MREQLSDTWEFGCKGWSAEDLVIFLLDHGHKQRVKEVWRDVYEEWLEYNSEPDDEDDALEDEETRKLWNLYEEKGITLSAGAVKLVKKWQIDEDDIAQLSSDLSPFRNTIQKSDLKEMVDAVKEMLSRDTNAT